MRFLLAGVTAMALVGPAASAAAEPCVCLAGPTPSAGALAPALSVTPLSDAAVDPEAPVSEPTMGDDALSRPVDELASLPMFVVVADGHAPTPEQVLWCEGSDDPRCSPSHGTPVVPELSSPPPAALATLGVNAEEPDLSAHAFARTGLGAAQGARSLLERPPQA